MSDSPAAAAFEPHRALFIKYGFAPGDYISRCMHCHEQFIGDKRASSCFPCAAALIRHLEGVSIEAPSTSEPPSTSG